MEKKCVVRAGGMGSLVVIIHKTKVYSCFGGFRLIMFVYV